uniref:Uncharacterized protein n=1 Tax=Romanomermis culicivorax TaxID=13658 RepID=A0A915HHR4_ROMCU
MKWKALSTKMCHVNCNYLPAPSAITNPFLSASKGRLIPLELRARRRENPATDNGQMEDSTPPQIITFA